MAAYLITGPNGSGKSTVGRELAKRGYTVIETDFESGISGWFEKDAMKRITTMPPHPLSPKWLANHSWLWDKQRIQQLIDDNRSKLTFFCGGAYNQKDMYDLFDQHFTLYVDDKTAIKRLQGRGELNRWNDGSAELENMLAWNAKSKRHGVDSGGVIIDSSRPVKIIADEILGYVNDN